METRGKKSKTDKQMFDDKNREDIVHMLEQVWCLEPEDTFYKIFQKALKRGIPPILHMSKVFFQIRVERGK